MTNAKRLKTKATQTFSVQRLALVVAILLITYHFSLITSSAQVPALPSNPATKINPSNASSLPSTIINVVLTPLLVLIGFFAALYIVLAGLKYIRSGGDPKAAEEARARLTFAIVGFVITILAVAITQIVDKVILGGTGVI